ncbi:T9SS type A sorting domain-containing protein [candidate division KSB1 bacterium]|nr:T9SS type A sorting domain-containing protein [candidate division KSB1 bacterium]
MDRLRATLVIALLALSLSATATVHTVTVSNFQFSPATVTIQLGDTVVWNNTGGTHNVNHTGNPQLFRSGNAAPAPWTYQYPNASQSTPLPVGSYPYVCQPHAPGMAGTVVVEAAAAGDVRAELPAATELSQNFPNPFNANTEIVFSLQQSTPVKLAVYNVLGESVRSLIDGELSAGTHRLNFDASGLSTGIYYYALATPTTTLTRKMLFMK